MGLSIGIDLGTTNTVAAIMEGPRPKIIITMAHESSTRSVVYMHEDGQPLVGAKAYDRAGTEPESTVISIKRLIGRQYEDKHVQKSRTRYQYPIEQNPNGTGVVIPLRGRHYTPTEISAMILRQVKESAERYLGQEVTHAVISVPAYFDLVQREQTRIAGESAGLRVKQIISEPTAAAIAYGLDQDEEEPMTVVVYDLGGATFDISCLMSQSGMHAELGKEGDMWLGGDDFDQAIVEYCWERIKHQYDGPDPSKDREFMFALCKAAKKAKEELGEFDRTEVMPFRPLQTRSGPVTVCVPITRMRFEELIRGHIDRTVKLMEEAMRSAELAPYQVDCVLLVGGSTAVPLVRETLIAIFGGDKISQNTDAMTCVAVGAAKLARDLGSITCPNPNCKEPGHLNPLDAAQCELCGFELTPEVKCRSCGTRNPLEAEKCGKCGEQMKLEDLYQVTVRPVGIEVEGGQYEVIMPKNSPYPSPSPYTVRFVTATAAQEVIHISLCEGECLDDIKRNQFLGAGEIRLEEQVPAGTPVDVSIRLDRDGVLHCEVRVHFGNLESYRFSIAPRLGAVSNPPQAADAEDDDWRVVVGFYRVYNLSSTILDRFTWLLANAETEELRQIHRDLESADSDKDRSRTEAAVAKGDRWFEQHHGAYLLALGDFFSRDSRVDSGIASQLGDCISRIASSASQGNSAQVQSQMSELDRLVDGAITSLRAGEGDFACGLTGGGTALKAGAVTSGSMVKGTPAATTLRADANDWQAKRSPAARLANEAVQAANAEGYDRALELIGQAAKLDPLDPQIRKIHAAILTSRAVQIVNQASAAALRRSGHELLEQAAQLLRQALEIDQDNHQARANVAVLDRHRTSGRT